MSAATVEPGDAANRPMPRTQPGHRPSVRNVRHGQFERAMSALTASGRSVTGVEIWLEHDRASFSKP